MTYDVFIPIKIGLFTLTTALLIMYFLWLIEVLRDHPKRYVIVIAVIHIIIMVTGLLLTGFA